MLNKIDWTQWSAMSGTGNRRARMLKAVVLIATASLARIDAYAQDAPSPPCEGSPSPTAGAIGDGLNQLVWMEDELPVDWAPPMCTGWSAGPTKVLLAGAGRFRMAGDSAALARRLTSISRLTEIVYWSSSRGRWRKLFEEAVALSQPDSKATRADFVEGDFVPDARLYYWLKEDNPTAGVVYEVTVHERTPSRIVFETVNATPVKAKLLVFRAEIAAPGEYRQLYYIEHERDDIWLYYSLVRMGRAGSLAGTSAANYRNRAEAYFRYLAGLKMDREPPAAR
jgi:Family of unknown function (DUF6675)